MMTRVRAIDAALALIPIKALLLTIGFARTLRFLEWRIRDRAATIEPDPATLNASARSVVAAAVLLPGRIECLEQSLALWYLLRRRGVGAELTFGMRQYPFGAHAWVTYRGEPLNEDREALRHYVAFA
ncbi:MAG TPA: lasso peptide biosynthesis B2 protein [Gemmatimonadaceae bacterium]|nr:lasso peptide biosynthesis B2 protein [Gemmatimonadaceae bacterium]